MILTKKHFDVLASIVGSQSTPTQKSIAETTGYSLETIEKTNKELLDMGFIVDGEMTQKGIDSLKPYRVKRAIFLAAGFGSRMVPITINTPKPLVRVNGQRIIDGLIDACLKAEIEEIYIVRGYLGEQFDQLLYKYPMIKFIDNPLYDKANNISSALVAKDLLSNAYVLEADLLISNPDIITKYHYQSEFLAIKKDYTDDWCFEVEDGIITKEKIGGENCHQMVGISYWSDEDGKKLSEDIQSAYDTPNGKNYYWEQIPLDVYEEKYKVAICECRDEDIVEIDTFDELKAIDKAYITDKG